MVAYVALLRAVNVGGTGKLAMSELRAMCEEAGFTQVQTYIASGNVVFSSQRSEAAVRDELGKRLALYAGKPVGLVVRTAEEMAAVVTDNPFSDKPGDSTVAFFLDSPPPADALAHTSGGAGEEALLGRREIYVNYPDGMGKSKFRIPAAKSGTARNFNTITKLAALASGLTREK